MLVFYDAPAFVLKILHDDKQGSTHRRQTNQTAVHSSFLLIPHVSQPPTSSTPHPTFLAVDSHLNPPRDGNDFLYTVVDQPP